MKCLIERIERSIATSPNKVILSDEYGEYTNRQLWEVSGHVYAYLSFSSASYRKTNHIHVSKSPLPEQIRVDGHARHALYCGQFRTNHSCPPEKSSPMNEREIHLYKHDYIKMKYVG